MCDTLLLLNMQSSCLHTLTLHFPCPSKGSYGIAKGRSFFLQSKWRGSRNEKERYGSVPWNKKEQKRTEPYRSSTERFRAGTEPSLAKPRVLAPIWMPFLHTSARNDLGLELMVANLAYELVKRLHDVTFLPQNALGNSRSYGDFAGFAGRK